MKTFKIYAITFALSMAIGVHAQDCDVNLSVENIPGTEEIPQAAADMLATHLTNAVAKMGVSANENAEGFFIAGKFNHVTQDITPGPPMQTAVHTMLTLYIGNASTREIFASQTFDLRGVGTTEQRALINAMRPLNARNTSLAGFVDKGKRKIINYYDTHYQQIIAQAERAATTHDYEQALYLVSNIPSCSVGYGAANQALKRYFKQYIDLSGTQALRAARSIWAANPTAEGAQEALAYLMQIDPESSAYPGAEALLKEMKTVVKDDKDFELRQKYNDQIDLEKREIEAARAVGVAFGNGQKPTTTNLMWLR